MSRKMTILIACGAVLLGLSMAGASFIHTAATVPVVTTAVIAQAVPMQARAMVPTMDFQPVGSAFVGNPTVHITVGGAGPISGSYQCQEFRPGNAHARAWGSGFVTVPASYQQGAVQVQREVFPDGSIVWTGSAGCGIVGGNGQGAGCLPFVLNGTDFNCSGSGPYFGNPAFGGGGSVTITVAP